MKIDYKALGITNEMIPAMSAHVSLALGESLSLLISQGKEINKDNLLKTLINEIEKKHDDIHRAYRLAIEILAIHGR
ncbi:hypothetical protein NFJ68_16650 [Klebsiella aerogenes]|uniref:hypothetical protein n=1 Tax=Klebsiella TaxID=570 RepID=UPI0021DAF9ED|nr:MULTISPECIES: hypothetical protein [Klebsiella]MCU8823214.1 hypothetical protein [Klebsiella quasipneumoniae]WFV97685.1 hypothetical protein NFJ54_17130 [Klebsiella aerogenes]WFW25343.1 hypothetical protein NFJ68_16650 [Klebsiella aerogenes]